MRVTRFVNNFGLIILFTSLLSTSGFVSASLSEDASRAVRSDTGSVHVSNPEALLQTTQGPATGSLFVNPDNSRYFTDGSGKAIFLTGSHTWDNRQDLGAASFDYSHYLLQLQEYHHNFFRFWVWEQPRGITTSPDPAQPNATLTPEIFQRTGPGTAADGGLKFDVTQYNQAHFDRLRQRIIEAGNKGMYVSVMLFDGWSIEQKAGGANPWVYHPFNKNNNINGLNGDPNGDQSGAETHTLQITAITAAQEAYVRKVVDTVNDLDNVLYEISNESGADSTAWQYHMIDFVHNYEASKPKQHPVGMTVEWPGGNNSDLFASPADWIAPNGDGGYGDNPPVADGSKVVVLDTDHIWGIGGDRSWAWKSFTRGYNVLYMDPWDGEFIPVDANVDLRVNLGYIQTYAQRMNLAAMTPTSNTSLCSTGYCLRNAAASGAEYLAYLPSGGPTTINLSASQGTLNVEWFNPNSGTITLGGVVNGGAFRSFTPPFSGDAVLYIYDSTFSSTFSDVPTNYWAHSWIEKIYAAGLTGGCATNPLQYCPELSVTRAQMAVFLERGMKGSSYSPPPATGIVFRDVPASYWAAAWIENLAADGITSGCGGGNYCPDYSVTRAEMAIFLLRSKHGAVYAPPAVGASTGFSDVPTNYWAAAWIKQLAAEGITAGCSAGTYCPESPVNRAQMAVFLVRTFNLP